MDWGSRITYLASTALNKRMTPFGIKDKDRMQPVAVLGRVGSGRAALLARMALQDIERGLGVVILDVSGNLAPLIMERLDDAERGRIIHIDPSDAEYPFAWDIVDEFRGTALGKEIFEAVMASMYRTPKNKLTDKVADHILAKPGSTVLDMFNILVDDKSVAAAFSANPDESAEVMDLYEAEKQTVDDVAENGRYLAKDTMVRNVLGQTEGKFALKSLNEGAILIVDLSRIRIFPTRITPLVRLFSASARAQAAFHNMPVGLYIHDGLRYFTETDSEKLFADRSIALTISDTIYHEGDTPLREKALAKAGSLISFQPHPADVELVEHIFYPYVTAEELLGFDEGEACVALTIDGVRSRPFFAHGLDLPERKNFSLQDMYAESRDRYTHPRLQADQTFVKKVTKDDGPPGEGGEGGGGGSFSDAFRSIFAKGAAPAPAIGPDGKPLPLAPPTPSSAKATEGKKGETPPGPTEVDEADLKALLYVGPLPA